MQSCDTTRARSILRNYYLHTKRCYFHRRSFARSCFIVISFRIVMRHFKKKGEVKIKKKGQRRQKGKKETSGYVVRRRVVKLWISPRSLAYCINVSPARLAFHRSSHVAVSSDDVLSFKGSFANAVTSFIKTSVPPRSRDSQARSNSAS